MGGTECFIDVKIAKKKITLLLSKQSLKNAQAVIDIANDKVSIFDKNVDLIFLLVGTIAWCPVIRKLNFQHFFFEKNYIFRFFLFEIHMIFQYIS